jgi:beta-glucosidase
MRAAQLIIPTTSLHGEVIAATPRGPKLRWINRRVQAVVLGGLLVFNFGAPAQNVVGKGARRVTGNARVNDLIDRMTLDEKIAMLHGAGEPQETYQGQAGYLPGVPRLRIPPLRFADGPPGVLTRTPSTALTATMGVAATFSERDAYSDGAVIGHEATTHGIDVALQPYINLDRDVTFRRSYNTFGEDPLLTGHLGAAEIRGIQDRGVMAQAKHFIGYEADGAKGDTSYNIVIDQRTLHELYLEPFADAVAAGVSSIMCAYNKINGRFSCDNPDTLKTILKEGLGFSGFVTSDWSATHGTLFINNGLDVEMPGTAPSYKVIPGYFAGDTNLARSDLKKAVLSGEVTESTLDHAVGRVLLEMDRFGFLKSGHGHGISLDDGRENAATVRRTSEDAAVLLKNDQDALPLRAPDLDSLVLIGPGARQVVAVGQSNEKALGIIQREVSPVDALKQELKNNPHAQISLAVADDMTGEPIPAANLQHDDKPGLLRIDRTGGPMQVDPQLNFTVSGHNALSSATAYQWTGDLVVPASGQYAIHLQLLGCFGSLRLDGKQVGAASQMFLHGRITQAAESSVLPTTDALDNVTAELQLSAGLHKLVVSAEPDLSGAPMQVRINWLLPQQKQADFEAAVKAAKSAHTAIVFVWDQANPGYMLPAQQDRLVDAVASVNPHTIVVLNTAQPTAMPWLNKVRAVLELWWPGDEGGWSTADVLLGTVSPAGRLPFTWATRLNDYPATDPAFPERLGNRSTGETVFSEGIFIGYRWFDKKGITPLFPFGYGLSYTHFAYSRLKLSASADGGIDAEFQLKNEGDVSADEVPQLYIGAPRGDPEGLQFAVRSLGAFDRICFAPGEQRTVKLHVPLRQFQYWSIARNSWVTPAGPREVFLGRSSRDLPLRGQIELAKHGAN